MRQTGYTQLTTGGMLNSRKTVYSAHRLKLAGIFGCNRPPAPIPVSAQPEALPCSQRFNLEIPSPKVPRRASLHSVGRTFAQGLHAVARRDRAAGSLHGYPDDQLAVAMHAEDMHLGAQTTQPISNHSRTQSPQSMPTAWQFTNRGMSVSMRQLRFNAV